MGSFISHFVLDSRGLQMPSSTNTFYPYFLELVGFITEIDSPLDSLEYNNSQSIAYTTLDTNVFRYA